MAWWKLALGVGLAVLVALGGAAGVARADGLVAHTLRVSLPSGPRQVTLWLEPGFEIGVAASGLPDARFLAQSPTGELVLSQHYQGRVVKLTDANGDGTMDEVVPLLTGLSVPNGVVFAGDVLFVAETDRVLRLDTWWSGGSARPIISLPGGGHHETRSLALGPDGKLYVSAGAGCDACEEADPHRAAIWRYDLDGSNGELYARGLRNAVGMTWNPADGRFWVTDNGRNDLGDDRPPDELDLVRQGADYGYPACSGDRAPDPPYGSPVVCANTEPPAMLFPPHSAPLGLAFYTGTRFPASYNGDLFVAVHGSALREDAVGYEVLRVPMPGGSPGPATVFARGWLVGDDSWGRPVSPFVAADGTLYITDDKGGLVYWIRPTDSAR